MPVIRVLPFVTAAVLLASPPAALAQGEWTYRARAGVEGAATSLSSSGLLFTTADSTWDDGRLRVGGGLIFTGEDGGQFDVRARELFGRVSATPWMDVEVGKRLVRWGVGYGFAPTGVLDPARVATDPTDRLGRNEGTTLVRADLFRGGSSITLAATAHRVAAARARTVIGGVEIALVARVRRGERVAWGVNLTHVVGERLEWHAEFLSHDRGEGAPPGRGQPPPPRRAFSAVAGLQYTFTGGANVVLEYHRNGHGLDDGEWAGVLAGTRPPGVAPARRQFLFLRIARSGAEAALAPELIVIAGLDDGGWTIVPGVTWTPRARLQVYARVLHLAGPKRSVVANAPWSTSFTIGTAVRF